MLDVLDIVNLRAIKSARFALARANVILGQNGSGKTTVLEALYLLNRGKSFRHHQARHIIAHGQDGAFVSARAGVFEFSAQKTTQKTTLRLNGEPQTVAQMSRALPILMIEPSAMDMLEIGSQSRRAMLDFLCFYQDHAFYGVWLDYSRALKQRNALLKFGKNDEIFAWGYALSQSAPILHAIRAKVFARWADEFLHYSALLLPKYIDDLCLSYSAGFEGDLLAILSERLAKDRELGYTRIGAHRADVRVMLGKRQAVDVLSRGEKKLLIVALKLASLFATPSGMVMIDDIDAELDDTAMTRVLDALSALDVQVFLTSLSPKMIDKARAHFLDVAGFWLDDGAIMQNML